ncbi:hypothetical protein B0I31_102395 [Saccharothrix carnea]|uniref:Phage integrase family protein n=1 Tax=Saccharothrix carnea TaxID=1280637 RepID=A0A2P8IG36_SACCR|nr:hypothetical protein B0I31_102395 [Saccharothrix carnea]
MTYVIHKRWLIEDGVPEILQCKRLGHRMAGVRGIYSHVTQVMVDAMPDGLQRRWERSLRTLQIFSSPDSEYTRA